MRLCYVLCPGKPELSGTLGVLTQARSAASHVWGLSHPGVNSVSLDFGPGGLGTPGVHMEMGDRGQMAGNICREKERLDSRPTPQKSFLSAEP